MSETVWVLCSPAIFVECRYYGPARSYIPHPRLENVWIEDCLENFDVVSLDAYRHRSLNRIDGHNEGVITRARLEDSFNSVESSASHSHTLSDFQKGMTTTRHVAGEKNSNRINLL